MLGEEGSKDEFDSKPKWNVKVGELPTKALKASIFN
jgi:hypothetical protein